MDFDKCIHFITTSTVKVWDSSLTLKIFSPPFVDSPFPRPRQITVVSPFLLEFCIIGIIQYVVFCIWLLALSIIFWYSFLFLYIIFCFFLLLSRSPWHGYTTIYPFTFFQMLVVRLIYNSLGWIPRIGITE